MNSVKAKREARNRIAEWFNEPLEDETDTLEDETETLEESMLDMFSEFNLESSISDTVDYEKSFLREHRDSLVRYQEFSYPNPPPNSLNTNYMDYDCEIGNFGDINDWLYDKTVEEREFNIRETQLKFPVRQNNVF